MTADSTIVDRAVQGRGSEFGSPIGPTLCAAPRATPSASWP